MVTHFDPNDLAKWTKAWAANPGKSLVYLQYGPSIPAYLKLAGKAANGIIWATVTGVYNDPVGKIFRAAYKPSSARAPGSRTRARATTSSTCSPARGRSRVTARTSRPTSRSSRR